MVFITPTRRAIIGGLVDEAHLLNATGLHTMSQNANRVFLPLLAGFLFARYGAEWAYVLIVGMYLVAIVLMFAVPVRGAGASPLPTAQRVAIGRLPLCEAGARHPQPAAGGAGHHRLRSAVPASVAAGAGVPHDRGRTASACCSRFFGVGSLLGSTTAASLGDFRRKGLLLVGFFTLFGLGVVGFAASSWYVLSLLLMLPVGIGHSGRTVVHLATLQAYSDAEMRGRVQALNAMMGGLIPIAVLGITGLAELFGGRVALASAGSVIVAYGIWETLFSKTLRNLR